MPQLDTTSKVDDLDRDLATEDDGPEAAVAKIAEEEKERKRILSELALKIEGDFRDRSNKRLSKEVEWAKARSLYDAPLGDGLDGVNETPFENKKSASRRPVPNIVRTKCDTAVANCVSLQFAAGEKNWDLFPPANVLDQAVANACRAMEKEIEAQLSATKYAMHSRRAMEDRVILGTGVLKGPVNTGKMRVEYVKDPTGVWVPQVSSTYSPKTVHVPLWRFYTDMTVTDHCEAISDIEVHPMTSIELAQYIEHPGFDGAAIKSILAGDEESDPVKPDHYNDEMLKLSAETWSRNPYLYKNRYTVLEYHGPISYDAINKLGLEPTYESPTQEYYGEVWVCAGRVIRMELENIEGYYETPYCVSVWKRDPSSPYGYGHPLLLADPQRVVEQAYHMILDNAALTSGPQIAMYQKYIQPVDGDWTIGPNKVWLLTDPSASIEHAIKFFNPTNVIPNIMPVLELARQFAEEESATMAFGGMSSPQNQDSATGALITQHSSNTLLDFSAEEWDDQVTEKLIRRYYAWNMQYSPREDIKGDYVVDVKSSSEYKNKQLYVRDLERLSMEATQNPAMGMFINLDELQKARLALMHLPSNRIMKNDEEIAQAREQMAQQPNPQMIELQIKQQANQLEQMRIKIEEQKLQFENTKAQQREIMEHQERMAANYARVQEAQAAVLKARSEVQVAMLQLASKDKQVMSKIATDREMKELAIQSQVFLKSMEETRKQQENMLTQEELKLAKTTGEGI